MTQAASLPRGVTIARTVVMTCPRIEQVRPFTVTARGARSRGLPSKDRDLANAITDVALAGVLWLYWRRVAAHRPPAATWDRT